MAIPPVHTWKCLFDEDTSYECQGCPSWFQDPLETGHGSAGRRVIVAWNSRADRLPDADSMDGLVAVNDRSIRRESLERSGFKYVRHFAVVPSLRSPRFFVPLDAPRVSAGAFSIYKPVRWQSRWKHWGAKVAARAGSHFWYRDHIWIAQRRLPHIERLLSEHFVQRTSQGESNGPSGNSTGNGDAPRGEIRLAISSGNAETVRNRKLTMAVMNLEGSAIGFGKLSLSSLSRHRVQHEATVLETFGRSSDRIPAPKLLMNERVGQQALIVTSPLSGHVPSCSLSPAHRDFLAHLELKRHMPVSETELVQSLVVRRAIQTELDGELYSVLAAIMPVLESLVLPAVTVHRDFAPWNLRQNGGVLTAFDWEYAELEGPPLLDELHHQLAVEYFVRHSTPERAADQFLRFAATAPMGLRAEQIHALQTLYLVDHLFLLRDEGYEADYPKFRWWREVLARLQRMMGSGATPAKSASL